MSLTLRGIHDEFLGLSWSQILFFHVEEPSAVNGHGHGHAGARNGKTAAAALDRGLAIHGSDGRRRRNHVRDLVN
jgi:hypothetical protein